MKKMVLFGIALCLLVSCTGLPAVMPGRANAEEAREPAYIFPFADSTMENLTDATLSVSLSQGDVYLDEEGTLQMKVKIYVSTAYDTVDIIMLSVGDILVGYEDQVKVTALEKAADGTVIINGGVENGGFQLVPSDAGLYYIVGANDAMVWYQIGEATLPVSADFTGYDYADPEIGEDIFYAGSFLVNEITNYDFTPNNTTIRIENGEVVELYRAFMP